MATNERWNTAEGKKAERTEWHRIVAFGKLAEICGRHLAKGRTVYIEGRLQTRAWEKDGEKRAATEIIAGSVQFLGGNGKPAPGQGRQHPLLAPAITASRGAPPPGGLLHEPANQHP